MCAQVTKETDFAELLDANPWMRETKLVVKPDMLFGKRGKHDLVGLKLSVSEVEDFITARMGKVPGLPGTVTRVASCFGNCLTWHPVGVKVYACSKRIITVAKPCGAMSLTWGGFAWCKCCSVLGHWLILPSTKG